VIGGKGYTAPSDMINLGFLGTGKQARGLLNSFKDKANIIAGSDVDINKLHYFHSLANNITHRQDLRASLLGIKDLPLMMITVKSLPEKTLTQLLLQHQIIGMLKCLSKQPMQVNMCIARSLSHIVLKREEQW